MNGTAAGPFSEALAQRESGLIVPAHLAHAPEEPAEGSPAAGLARDPDGRRRIVLARDTRRRFNAVAKDLARDDLAFILWCKTKRQVTKLAEDVATGQKVPVMVEEPIEGACGEVMLREGEGTPDPGFGCKCTRVHFTRF